MIRLPEALLNINGTLTFPATDGMQAAQGVSPWDRSYLYGDSLYEVARTYDQKLFALREHLTRLGRSCELCHFKPHASLTHYASEMERTTNAYFDWRKQSGLPLGEAYCRLVLSRGAGGIGFSEKTIQAHSLYTIYVQPLTPPSPTDWERGLNLFLATRLRNSPKALDPAMKSGNYLNSVLAFLEAQDAGCDDAILKDNEGFLTEGTTFNLGYIRNGRVATAPLDVGILDGITRKLMLRSAERAGIPIRVVRYTAEHLLDADEVFVTSTIKEVFPVTRINNKPVGHRTHRGKPGPLTAKLKNAFHEERVSHG